MAGDPNQWRKFYYDEIEASLWGPIGPVVIFASSLILAFYIYQNPFLNNEPIAKIPLTILAIWIFCSAIMSGGCWFLIFKRQPKFANDEIGIVVAITKLDDKVDTELEKLYKKLELLINEERFESKIKVRLVPEAHRPKDEKAAHSLRDKMGGGLIIWGQADQGKHQDQVHTFFKPVHFSYNVSLPPQEASVINREFNRVLANEKWAISDRDSYIEREYLANNVEVISLYIIGTVLYFAGKNKESTEVIKKVLSRYNAKNVLSHDEKTAVLNLKSLLLNIYRKELLSLELWPNARNRKRDIEKAKLLIIKMNEYEFFHSAKLLECTVEFAEGGEESKKLGMEAYRINPNDVGACFSLAFLHFYDRELLEGWRWLSIALKHDHTPYMKFQSTYMARWYEEVLKDNPDWYHLHLPLGLIYFYLMNNYGPAKESLETFLSNHSYVANRSHASLIYRAKNVLKKIAKK